MPSGHLWTSSWQNALCEKWTVTSHSHTLGAYPLHTLEGLRAKKVKHLSIFFKAVSSFKSEIFQTNTC